MVDRIVVQRVEAARTYRLRRDVLRPERTIEEMALFGDDGADTAIFGAIDEATDELVGSASVKREEPPAGLLEDVAPGSTADCWRLRGMATRQDLRSQGVGGRVLEACLGHVAAQGGGFLWCNARVPARGFYGRGGFAEWGEEFESVGVTHIVMWRLVEAKGSGA
jgi:predicted GNAT family N-acyltransferase